jgi:para-aminobenzoate synthetase / 4-amino-4-deoxychorismate lyase
LRDSIWEEAAQEHDVMLLQHALPNGASEWLLFRQPQEVLAVRTLNEVQPVLHAVEKHTRRGGWAAGFVSYEAAPAFDSAFETRAMLAESPPYVHFGLHAPPLRFDSLPHLPPAVFPLLRAWQPSISREAYLHTLARIHAEIAAGNTYQVNFTYRLQSVARECAPAMFTVLIRAQRPQYGAWIRTASHDIASASPELFFHRHGTTITMRPMKGTAARGLTPKADDLAAARLAASVKDRAENLMIVDMARNDLSRIARTGSVRVPRMFEVERYPTVLQMTSTVEADTAAPLPEIFAALFPCASITGAPKVSTMRLIRELETTPRGVYTGAIGLIAPDGEAQFNVAIRTLTVQTSAAVAEYGTGGGIVWDSDPEAELAECQLKAKVLDVAFTEFYLLETMFCTPERGIFLQDRHLDRLCDSAATLHFSCDRQHVAAKLAECTKDVRSRQILRLLLSADGAVTVEMRVCEPRSRRVKIALAHEPVDGNDPFLQHKTTHRDVYEAARRTRPDVDDVLLWNTRGEITESCTANVVIRRGRNLVTPPVESGLLAGTCRAELVARGRIREAIITVDDMRSSDQIFLINSVRGWMRAELIP